MLTPTFHFSILSSFVDVYNRQSNILIKQLKPLVDQSSPFDIFPYIGRCALDIIGETAMGNTINAQMNLKSDYVQAVKKYIIKLSFQIGNVLTACSIVKEWYYSDIVPKVYSLYS